MTGSASQNPLFRALAGVTLQSGAESDGTDLGRRLSASKYYCVAKHRKSWSQNLLGCAGGTAPG